MSLEILRTQTTEIQATVFPPPDKLRFINWYLLHNCNLRCNQCRVPDQPTTIMSTSQRQEALARLRSMSLPGLSLSIFGGEPTINPGLLLDAVKDGAEAGYFVSLVSNLYNVTPKLIDDLGAAGLKYLGISLDSNHYSDEDIINRGFSLLDHAKTKGIVPVVNTLITSKTDTLEFKQFTNDVLNRGFFISPIPCSPQIPNGEFSNASLNDSPTASQTTELVPWLAWKKFITGRVTISFTYLQWLYKYGRSKNPQFWHCSPYFRNTSLGPGKGYLTLDSDGYIGPCQEFPHVVNLLSIPSQDLSLKALNPQFSEITHKCPGCLYHCFFMEENQKGPVTLTELGNGIQVGRIINNGINQK